MGKLRGPYRRTASHGFLIRVNKHDHIISSSSRFANAARRTFCSTPSTLPSKSAQLSPIRRISIVYHRCIAAALLSLNSAISTACDACKASTFAIRGTKSINWAESSAGGIGTSRIEVRRDAVVGYELADARTIDNMLAVSNVVGKSSELIDWNKSGYLESECLFSD